MSIPVPVDAPTFRAAAPVFANPAMYPDASIVFWLSVAGMLLNASRWKDMLGVGTILFVEHNLALEACALQAGNAGGIPGMATGVISSESAKSLSASYDTGLAAEKDAGHWNLTTFGSRLMRMTNMFGMGPIQVNTGPAGYGGFFVLSGWTGPSCGPGWGNRA